MKGIIFDMDGTMIDNMMVHHRAWQQKLSDLGLEMSLEKVHREVHGISDEILLRLFGNKFSTEERERIAREKEEEYRRIYKPELKLVDGLPELLEAISREDIPMAIATASPKGNVDFVMDNLDLRHYFGAILHAGHVDKGKPDPEIYLKTAAALNLKPEDCLVFEDTPTGTKAASAAGCNIIAVTTTHQKEEFLPDKNIITFIDDFMEFSLEDIKAEGVHE